MVSKLLQYINKQKYKDQLDADKKAVTNRGCNFTEEEEDFFIATAWANASENNTLVFLNILKVSITMSL